MADEPANRPDTITHVETASDKRCAMRHSVFKSAKILFAQSAIDCLALNGSATGVRVRSVAIMPLPERVTLEFSGGAVFSAARRWALGLELGFSLKGSASLPEASAHLASRVRQMLRAVSIEAPLRLLRNVRCFDDPALQATAASRRPRCEGRIWHRRHG